MTKINNLDALDINSTSTANYSGVVFTGFNATFKSGATPGAYFASAVTHLYTSPVTLDGTTHALPDPFMVIATQNPLEHHGTYPLPESQMDRFLMRLSMGYPDRTAEKEMIAGRNVNPGHSFTSVGPNRKAAPWSEHSTSTVMNLPAMP